MTFKRLPARYAGFLMPLVLSILMTFVVSGVATVKNLGLAPNFVPSWMSAWLISWIIAFPTLLGALPSPNALSSRWSGPPDFRACT